MSIELAREDRHWAMGARLCGLLWLAGGSGLIFFPFDGLVLFTLLGPLVLWVRDGKPYRYPFCLRLVK
jgi:uncharacterized Tic20 family protein